VRKVRGHPGIRAEKARLLVLTKIIDGQWPPWLNFEFVFGQPGGKDEMVFEGKILRGIGGLYGCGGKLLWQDINRRVMAL
jgi:hypothetical protein